MQRVLRISIRVIRRRVMGWLSNDMGSQALHFGESLVLFACVTLAQPGISARIL